MLGLMGQSRWSASSSSLRVELPAQPLAARRRYHLKDRGPSRHASFHVAKLRRGYGRIAQVGG